MPGRHGTTLAWVALVGATIGSWAFGHELSDSHGLMAVGVLTIGALKARVVLRAFMEIGAAPVIWQRATDAWIVICIGGILLALAGMVPLDG